MFRFLKKRKEEEEVVYGNHYQLMINTIYLKMYISEYFSIEESYGLRENLDFLVKSTPLDTVVIPHVLYYGKSKFGERKSGTVSEIGLLYYDKKNLCLYDDFKDIIEKVYEKDNVEISRRFIASMIGKDYETFNKNVQTLVDYFERINKNFFEKNVWFKEDRDKLRELLAN